MPRKARKIDRIPEGGRRPIPRSEGHPFLQAKSIAARSGGYSDTGEALHDPHARSLPAQIARKRPPHCRYCGELSIWPWGGQQVCARCETIRCRIEQAAPGFVATTSSTGRSWPPCRSASTGRPRPSSRPAGAPPPRPTSIGTAGRLRSEQVADIIAMPGRHHRNTQGLTSQLCIFWKARYHLGMRHRLWPWMQLNGISKALDRI
jgi:hypothetical protein